MKRKIEDVLRTTSLSREEFHYNDLGESLAERLFLYFHGTVVFDYDKRGQDAYVTCNLTCLFSCIALAAESAGSALLHIHMLAHEEGAEIQFSLKEDKPLPVKELYEYTCLGGMEFEIREKGISLHLPLRREIVLHLFTNHRSLLTKLDILAKKLDIM